MDRTVEISCRRRRRSSELDWVPRVALAASRTNAHVKILALDRGVSFTDITRALDCNRSYFWKARLLGDRLAGLYSRDLGHAVEKRPPPRRRILARTLER